MIDKILLVDDEKDIVYLLEEVLRKERLTNIKKHLPVKMPSPFAGSFSRM